MKKWRNWGIALALGATIMGGVPLISQAADETTTIGGSASQVNRVCSSMVEGIADFLGLTTDQVREERQSGKSLSEIASEKGASKDQLLEQMLDERKSQLDALVKEGKLTKEQANQYLAQMKDRMETMVERTETGRPGFGGRGQGKGMQPGSCGGMLNQQAPSATNTSGL
jgi:hypothetical protein